MGEKEREWGCVVSYVGFAVFGCVVGGIIRKRVCEARDADLELMSSVFANHELAMLPLVPPGPPKYIHPICIIFPFCSSSFSTFFLSNLPSCWFWSLKSLTKDFHQSNLILFETLVPTYIWLNKNMIHFPLQWSKLPL